MQLRLLSKLIGFFAILGFSACFKDIPTNTVVYQESFERGYSSPFRVYSSAGQLDSIKISEFNGSHVFGPFNNNLVLLQVSPLVSHNIVRIQFDLYIHGSWLGDHLDPVSGIPDAWQIKIDQNPYLLTTFSNTSFTQSYPGNYATAGAKFPAHSDAWGLLPGICATASQADGTTHYKFDYQTLHTSPSIEIALNDALQPAGSQCMKSWSIDNVVITVSTH